MRYILFLLLALPISAQAQNYPNHTSTYVNDFADLIDPETELRITQMLKSVEDQRGVEMTVVTIESRLDYGQSTSIEPFATGLFNYWGVGDATRNDGVMILVARTDRDMRIELGEGYPGIFDDRAQRVIDHHFLPYFKRDEYAAGIEAGVAETIKRTALEFDANGPTFASRASLEGAQLYDNATSGGILSWVLGIVAAVASFFGYKGIKRRTPRKCELCGDTMRLLNEEDDDAYLDEGQILEESIKSTDYDVWYCDRDGNSFVLPHRRWFSRHSKCPQCGYKAVRSNRKTVIVATTTSTGLAEINKKCRHCDYGATVTETIPKISTSSSSSSGGSFGGGSSSGGGASGSW